MDKITMRAARVNAGLTQAQAAEKLNVAVSTICNWERGKSSPRIEKAIEMCKLYKIPYNAVFFDP